MRVDQDFILAMTSRQWNLINKPGEGQVDDEDQKLLLIYKPDRLPVCTPQLLTESCTLSNSINPNQLDTSEPIYQSPYLWAGVQRMNHCQCTYFPAMLVTAEVLASVM